MSLPTNLTVARRAAYVRDIAGGGLGFLVFVKQVIHDITTGWTNPSLIHIDFVMFITAELIVMAICIEFLALFFAARSQRKAEETADKS